MNDPVSDTFSVITGLLTFAFVVAIYFAPSIVAWRNIHKNLLAIFLLNLFLGWTILGWVAALIWAVIKSQEDLAQCPFCKESIKPDALKCKHCGSTLAE